jgi:hypothetical protein
MKLILYHFRPNHYSSSWCKPNSEDQSLEPTYHIHVTPTGGLNMAGFEIENLQFNLCVVCGDRASGKDQGICRKDPG